MHLYTDMCACACAHTHTHTYVYTHSTFSDGIGIHSQILWQLKQEDYRIESNPTSQGKFKTSLENLRWTCLVIESKEKVKARTRFSTAHHSSVMAQNVQDLMFSF